MLYNWGPYFIVPSETLREFSGHVQLREWLDEALLENGEYEVLGLMHVTIRRGDREQVIARQNIADITIRN